MMYFDARNIGLYETPTHVALRRTVTASRDDARLIFIAAFHQNDSTIIQSGHPWEYVIDVE
jgi:hypothetical protein